MNRLSIFAVVLLGVVLLASCESATLTPLDPDGILYVQSSSKTDKVGLFHDGELVLPMEYENFRCFQGDFLTYYVIAEKEDISGVFLFTRYTYRPIYFAPHVDGYDIEGDLYWVGTLADGRQEVVMSQGKFGPCDEIVPITWGCVFRNGNLWGACYLDGDIAYPCKYKKIYDISNLGVCLGDRDGHYIVIASGKKAGWLSQSEIDTLQKYAKKVQSPYSFWASSEKLSPELKRSLSKKIHLDF